jgi:3-phenylpropionate/trans-cinnamate dioxygenase ferredoxin reductase component
MGAAARLDRIVIVGAGRAGVQSAAALRRHGFAGEIAVIGDEDGLPYERPPLSKAYLTAELGRDGLRLRPQSFYDRQAIELVTGRVVTLDRARRVVRLADGSDRPYDHLVLATGARPRIVPVPGAGLRQVRALRTAADAEALRAELRNAENVVIVGAGFLGLELAAACSAGQQVTVLDRHERALARSVSATTARHLTGLHRARGTEMLFRRTVTCFHGDRNGRLATVELTGGRHLPADLAVVATGATPCTELAAAAGLAVDNGIVTDAGLLTDDPHISAVGDCAAFPHPSVPGLLRLGSVQNAVGHAELVADRLTGGSPTYQDLPWFWSEQLSARVQIAGLGHDHDAEVVVGADPDAFSVLLFRDDEIVAVESVNRPTDHIAARQILSGGVPLHPWEASAQDFTVKGHLGARAARPYAVTG